MTTHDKGDDMTALERLEALLNEKDRELAALREEERRHDYGEEWAWMRQSESDEAEGLPVPRLEIRWRRGDWSWLATYALVYRHLLGYVVVQPLGITKSNGGPPGPPIYSGKVDTPYRDGAHIRHEMQTLNLPGYAICEGTVTKLEPMEER